MSFAAGFAKGFANTLSKDIEDSRERIRTLVDQGINSAKAVAPRYAQATAEYKNILEIGDIMKTRYGVTDEEFVALAQGTDITKLYESIVNEDSNRTAVGRSGVSKQDFINVVNMPETVLPENITREKAIAQIMGLQSILLDKEDDPKSEAAKTRTGALSLAEFLGLNPKLSAEKQLETMKVMGYDVSELEYFQATQGTKQKVIPGVTRTRDIVFDDIDYDKSSYDGTQRKFNTMIATRLAGEDISNPDIFRTTTGIDVEDKTVMRDNALEASMSMAKLELEIVNSGAGLGLIGPAARRNLLEGIFSQIDGGTAGIQELQTLMTNIENGNAITAINAIYNEKGRFTAEDYQSIINGVVSEASSEQEPAGSQPSIDQQTESALTDDDMGLPTGPVTLDEKPELATEAPVAPVEPEVEELQERIDAATDPAVQRALANELEQIQAEAEKPPARGSAREVAKRNIESQQRMREAMESVTREQWDEMSRKERRDAGLPVRPLDMWFAGNDAFKGEEKVKEEAPEELQNTEDFLTEYNSDIVEYLNDFEMTGEEDEEEFKYALASWFDENSNRADVVGMTAETDLDTLAKLYKTLFTNRNQ